MLRRLPVYLLLDVSESMIGPPLQSVQEGVRLMIRTLMRNPYALETVHMGIITFAARAETAVPLTELSRVSPPQLSVRPGTALGSALRLCQESISRDVVPTMPDRKGDYRPLVFILTDGAPTDHWEAPAADLKAARPRPTVTALGCGEEAEFGILTQIADQTVSLAEVTQEGLESLFSWVSASVAVSSRAPDAGDGEAFGVNLEKAPLTGGLRLVKYEDAPPRCRRPRVFVHASCRQTGRLYLVVFRADPGGDVYRFDSSHPLPEDFLSEGTAPASPADGSQLLGPNPCPYCGNRLFVYCGACKMSHCWDGDSSMPYRCPGCGLVSELESGDSWDLPGSQG